MVEFFVGGLAGIDVGVPEFEAIKHPGEFGCWGAGEQKSILLHSNLLIVSSRDAAQPLKVLTAALALSARNSHRRHR